MWNQIPSLQSLKLFDAVVRHHSMTRAAQETGVSQSAVSQMIRQLEEFVDTPLLDRSTRPMALTEAGLEFHRTVIETLGRLATAVEDMRKAGKGETGVVTVSCNLGCATYWLMPRLNYFSAVEPDISVHVMAAYQGAAGLHDGSDIAIRYGDGQWRDGPWEPLLRETIVPVCSPEYLARHGKVGDLDALARRRLIHVAVKDPDWLGWESYFSAVGPRRAKAPGDLRFGNYVQAVQSALTGDGIMLGWRTVVGDLIAANQLTIAYERPVHLENGYYINSSALRADEPQKTRFLTWLRKEADTTADFQHAGAVRRKVR
mgnify:CR=1 FL=1